MGCLSCGSDRMKTSPSGRTYCIPCRLAHEKRRKAGTGELGWRSSEEQRRIDNLPCPKCGGDRLRADFTDPSRCHVAPVVTPSDEGSEP